MKTTYKYNLANKISLLVLLGIFVYLLFFGYFQFYPFKILSFAETDVLGVGQYQVLNKTVQQGGLLYYRVNFEKYIDKTGRLTCNFQDGLSYRVPEFHSNLGIGKQDYTQVIDIPIGLPAGRYEYTCLITYEMMLGRLIQYRFSTDTFEVVERE